MRAAEQLPGVPIVPGWQSSIPGGKVNWPICHLCIMVQNTGV